MRPQLVRGSTVIGICSIHLSRLRPARLRRRVGLSTENAAHRIAVEWDDADGRHRGVYIIRRDTSSRLSVAAGGRLFPGVHGLATFYVDDTVGNTSVSFTARDGIEFEAAVHPAEELKSDLFATLSEASEFFERGALGLAPAHDGRLDALELRTARWCVEPMAVDVARSTLFERSLPPGSFEIDCALMMRDTESTWLPAEVRPL
jgi:hypothetical protein